MNALEITKTVAVIGAGTMGAGVAQVAAAAGHPVLLFDAEAGAAQKGLDQIDAGLEKQVARGRMPADERIALLGRIQVAATLEDLAPAALVI
ncbi:MAG TPA: 3-hydroxyacyl-CoA dehydrogenase NAD-binding domain-containing protein, partial [Thiolinea sp.]|nr:3-hydroxyacyl-CoA dehydrogenase NAD-binding domain-containing protein [Thiolinea sp.]